VKLLPALLLCLACAAPTARDAASPNFGLVVHGGAGTITRASLTPELEAQFRAELEGALRAGHAVLAAGGTSIDAVTAALLPLEESPLFNAGVGAVFTADGRCELDASIMDGATHGAGAVAAVTTIEHPILAARAVLEHSEHVLLGGPGAEAFAAEQGLALVPNEHFHTEHRRKQLREQQADEKHGTVGAVALDRHGHLAAGTSTGGMTNKRFGRVGDSPLIGAGTYADDATCAVSSTGWGEFFIRGVVAHDIAAQMRYGGRTLREAADDVILRRLTAAGGTGGVIAIDANGNTAMPFNTPGMYRGRIDASGHVVVEIYR
jgi:beta-aspartyl-peptidase (threonine type)